MKISKNRIRTIVLEQLSGIKEAQLNAAIAKTANDALDAAPNLSQALDKVQDPETGNAVLTHFINKLTAKGMDKSKLIRMMTDQFNTAKVADGNTIGKSSAAKTASPAPTEEPAK